MLYWKKYFIERKALLVVKVTVCDTAVRLEKAPDQRWSQLKVVAVVGKTDGDDKEDRLRDVPMCWSWWARRGTRGRGPPRKPGARWGRTVVVIIFQVGISPINRRAIYLTRLAGPEISQYIGTRSLGALWAPTSSWRPFRPLDFVLRALRALRPCDPMGVPWAWRSSSSSSSSRTRTAVLWGWDNCKS